VAGPQDPVILKSPSGTEAPAISRDAKSRANLSCTVGAWATDYPGSFVYQAPREFTYQWSRNGALQGGPTSAPTFVAKSAGSYACAVTAANQAGSASQGSAVIKVKPAKFKLTAKKKAKVKAGGVAKFKLRAVNQGDLQSHKLRVCVKLPKKAKGALKGSKCKTLGKLRARGKRSFALKIKTAKSAGGAYKVTFALHGGPGKPPKAKVIVG
jgi:hypothetical protein